MHDNIAVSIKALNTPKSGTERGIRATCCLVFAPVLGGTSACHRPQELSGAQKQIERIRSETSSHTPGLEGQRWYCSSSCGVQNAAAGQGAPAGFPMRSYITTSTTDAAANQYTAMTKARHSALRLTALVCLSAPHSSCDALESVKQSQMEINLSTAPPLALDRLRARQAFPSQLRRKEGRGARPLHARRQF